MLATDPDSRRVVLQIRCEPDPGRVSAIRRANDMIFCSLRPSPMRSPCWISRWRTAAMIPSGAYGANAVQFSFIQECMAAKIGALVGMRHPDQLQLSCLYRHAAVGELSEKNHSGVHVPMNFYDQHGGITVIPRAATGPTLMRSTATRS